MPTVHTHTHTHNIGGRANSTRGGNHHGRGTCALGAENSENVLLHAYAHRSPGKKNKQEKKKNKQEKKKNKQEKYTGKKTENTQEKKQKNTQEKRD